MTIIISFFNENQLSSFFHIGFAIFLFYAYIEKYHEQDDGSAYITFLIFFLLDMYGRSIVPAIKGTSFFYPYIDKIGLILGALDAFFIAPVWFFYLGWHIRTDTNSGKWLKGIFLIVFMTFFVTTAYGIVLEDVQKVKVTMFDRKDIAEKYCSDEIIKEAGKLYYSNGIKALTEPRVTAKKEYPPYLETIDCDFPIYELRLAGVQAYYKIIKKSNELTKKASNKYDTAMLEATGGYYEGEIDEAEKDNQLGVYIEEVDYAKPIFFEDRPSFVVAKIKGKSRNKPIPITVSCGIYDFNDKGKPKLLKKGILNGETENSEKGQKISFNITGKEERDISCRIDNTPGNSKFVRFDVEFNDTVLSSLKTYFMNAETLDSFGPDQDPLDFYGITDKEPIARSTFGPFIVGMKTKNPPIGISFAERDVTNPQLILGMTLDNQWEGKIEEIREMKLQLPLGFQEEIYCSSYMFIKSDIITDERDKDYITYVIDKSLTQDIYLNKIPENEELDGKRGNVNFFCNLKVQNEKELLGNSPISAKFFRLTVDFKYKIFKDFRVVLSKDETASDPSSYFAVVYKRPENQCTLKKSLEECSVNFCYPKNERVVDGDKVSYKFLGCEKCSDRARECSYLINKEDCQKDPCMHLCYWNADVSGGLCLPLSQQLLSEYAIKGNENQMYWPTSSNKVRSCFGPSKKGFRYGIDIEVEPGKDVFAAEKGVVINVIFDPIAGIEIEHFPGFKTRYYYLKDINVVIGKYVQKGEIIGKTGFNFDNSAGKILYFEIVDSGLSGGTSRVNPLVYDTNVYSGYYNPSKIIWSKNMGTTSNINLDFKKDSNCCNINNQNVYRMDSYGTCEGEY